jgi:hypothetical protein
MDRARARGTETHTERDLDHDLRRDSGRHTSRAPDRDADRNVATKRARKRATNKATKPEVFTEPESGVQTLAGILAQTQADPPSPIRPLHRGGHGKLWMPTAVSHYL